MTDHYTEPLGRFPIVHTTKLDQAREVVARVYLPHTLDSRDGDHLRMALNAVEARNFTLGFLAYGAEIKLDMPATETCYMVKLQTQGTSFGDRQDGSRAESAAGTSGIILLPDQFNTMRWTSDAQQLILKISRTRLESHLSDLIGHHVENVINFDFDFDMTTPRGRSLLESVEFLARELNRPGGIAEMPLAREQLESFVMSQVLMAVRNPYTDNLVGPAEPVRPARLKPVLEYMRMNADEPLTAQELARVGCMSIRSLQVTFQQELGMSPMAYLRRLRLDRVRTELLRCGGLDVRVTDIAMRWGFFHPSRFAQQYREQFGELPSDTLRRHFP